MGNDIRRRKWAAAVLFVTGSPIAWAFQRPATQSVTVPSAQPLVFEKDILPIWKANTCLGCHGPSLKTKDLDLSSYAGIQKGSESGAVVIPGKPDESRLYRVVHDGLMPPGGKTHLSEADLGVVRSWIEGGAKAASGNAEEEADAKLTQDDNVPIMYLH
jgi:mono/diheme cytochrome c family protein